MAKLTFSFSDQAGDIPTYKFTLNELRSTKFNFVEEQLNLCDDKVFVLFETFKDCDYSLEHLYFYITNESLHASAYFYDVVDNYYLLEQELNFNFFCFKTYQEAFKYCSDLKEGL
jgi:hypothetical protein